MKPETKTAWIGTPVWVLVAMLLVASIAFSLLSAWKGYPTYRDIHLGAAIEYTKSSISLENTRIVGFNATGTPTIQEFPLWQGLVAMVFNMIGIWSGWASLVSAILFATSLYPLYQLAKATLDSRGGLWSLVFYLSQPLVFKYIGLGSTDGTSLSVSIWFLFFGFKLISAPTFRFLLWSGAVLAGIMAALLKLPFFMAAGIGLFCYLVVTDARSLRNWVALASVGLVAATVFFAWTRYTDRLQAGAVFPFVDLRLSNPELVWWFFGDWKSRLSLGTWLKGGWRVLNCLFGSFVLLGLGFLGGWKSRPPKLPLCLLFGGVVTTLIFSHLVLEHSHYYLMYSSAVAMLCSNAFLWLMDCFPINQRKQWVMTGVLGILLGLSLLQGLIGMKIAADFDPYYQRVASIVAEHTTPQEKILIQGGGWGGDILMRSNRRGLSIWDTGILEDRAKLQALKDLGYSRLVMISESPLLTAIQKVNPGDADRKRWYYKEKRTPVVEDWPVLYQSDDIVIQEIP